MSSNNIHIVLAVSPPDPICFKIASVDREN